MRPLRSRVVQWKAEELGVSGQGYAWEGVFPRERKEVGATGCTHCPFDVVGEVRTVPGFMAKCKSAEPALRPQGRNSCRVGVAEHGAATA